MKNNKSSYGWIIIISCFFITFLIGGLGSMPFSLYTVPVTDYLHISRTSYSVTLGVRSLIFCAVGLFYGRLTKIFGLKKLLIVGCMLCSGGYVVFSISNGLFGFLAGNIFYGIGCIFAMATPLVSILNNWFVARRGTIIGVVYAASGIGGIIFCPLVGKWILSFGWKISFLVSGVIMLIVSVPFLFLIKIYPSEKGQNAYGDELLDISGGIEQNDLEKIPDYEGLTFSQARKTVSFWLVCLAQFLLGLSINPAYTNTAARLMDVGYSAFLVSSVIMISLYITNSIAKIVMGFINDKLGIIAVILIGCASSLIAMIILIFIKSSLTFMAITSAAFMGIGLTMITIPLPLMVNKIFGNKDFITIMGLLIAISNIGVSAGIPLSNRVYDQFGSYTFAYAYQVIMVIFLFVSSVLALKLRPKVIMERVGNIIEKSDVNESF